VEAEKDVLGALKLKLAEADAVPRP